MLDNPFRPMYDQTFLAWAAGFFDGEGTACILQKGRTHRLYVCLPQKVREPLDKLKATFGGSVYAGPDIYRWQVKDVKAADFLAAVLPYLTVKFSVATLALGHQAKKGYRGKRPISDIDIACAAGYKERIRQRNQREVVDEIL